jgi:hypothetical protein
VEANYVKRLSADRSSRSSRTLAATVNSNLNSLN